MPRYLSSVLERLEADPTCVELEEVGEYQRAWYFWAEFGIVVDDADIARVRALWSARVDLRPALLNFIEAYPCDAFEGPFCKLVERDQVVDYAGWFRRYPRLQGTLRPLIVARAGQFNDPWAAVVHGLIWARFFDGGEDAYRAVALGINRRDRKWTTVPDPSQENFLRHSVNDHGMIFVDEAKRVNVHLAELGAEPIDLAWVHQRTFTRTMPDRWREPWYLGRYFASTLAASWRIAGDRWAPEDVEIYARAWLRLDEATRDNALQVECDPLDTVRRRAAML